MKKEIISFRINTKITSVKYKKLIQMTLDRLHEAGTYLLPIFNEEYDNWKDLKKFDRFYYCRDLINNKMYSKAYLKEHNIPLDAPLKDRCERYAKYQEFSEKFGDIYSVYRNSVIIPKIIGDVENYRKNQTKLEEERKERRKQRRVCSYKDRKLKSKADFPLELEFRENKKFNTALKINNMISIRLFNGKTWERYYDVLELKQKDIDKIKEKYPNLADESWKAPALYFNGKDAHLSWPIEIEKIQYSKYSKDDIAVGVDLGLNTSAVMCAMNVKGEVLDRKFTSELDGSCNHLQSLLRKKDELQSESGEKATLTHIWNKIKNIKKHILDITCKDIIDFSLKNNAKVIVLENLGLKRKGKKQNISQWQAKKIQSKIEEKANRFGIKVSYVSAVNTSALAYDGSGKVKRNKKEAGQAGKKVRKSHEICIFKNGKIYNADLNASYNIASRYFIHNVVKERYGDDTPEIRKQNNIPLKKECCLQNLINLSK